MHVEDAHLYLLDSFTPGERAFLFAEPEFLKAVAKAEDDTADIKALKDLGLNLILFGGYVAPSTAPKKPPGERG